MSAWLWRCRTSSPAQIQKQNLALLLVFWFVFLVLLGVEF